MKFKAPRTLTLDFAFCLCTCNFYKLALICVHSLRKVRASKILHFCLINLCCSFYTRRVLNWYHLGRFYTRKDPPPPKKAPLAYSYNFLPNQPNLTRPALYELRSRALRSAPQNRPGTMGAERVVGSRRGAHQKIKRGRPGTRLPSYEKNREQGVDS